MYGWHGWWMGWMGWMWGFWIVVIVLVVWLAVRAGSQGRENPRARLTPEEILRERLARGEIDTEEFQRRMDVLRQGKRVA
jgi:putative membrane protein